MIGNINLPLFTSGIVNPDVWINQSLSTLAWLSNLPAPIRITALPTTVVPGTPYLLLPTTSYGTAGHFVIFFSNLNTSGINIVPVVGQVIGGYTATGSSWVRTEWVNAGILIISTAGTFNVPVAFDGTMDVVVKVAGVFITSATRILLGKANTSLPVGVYRVYQDLTDLVI